MPQRAVLTRLEVGNFKSHKNTDVTLTPGINVIIGETDKGKTALMSAIRWVATGKPRGDSVKSWWGGKTSVKLSFGDNTTVEKTRVGTGTIFTVDGRPFKSTDANSPPEVDAALGLPEELCIQRQLDPVYMLSKTGGQAAATINSVVDMDVVTGSQSEGLRAVRQCKSELDVATGEREAAEEEVESYEFLDDLSAVFVVVERTYEELKCLTDQCKRLQAACSLVQSAQSALAACPAPPDVQPLHTLVNIRNHTQGEFNALQAKVTFVIETIAAKKRFAHVPELKALADELPVQVSVLKELQREYAVLRSSLSAFADSKRVLAANTLSDDVTGLLSAVKTADVELASLRKEFSTIQLATQSYEKAEGNYVAATVAAMEAKAAADEATVVNGLCVLCKQPVRK